MYLNENKIYQMISIKSLTPNDFIIFYSYLTLCVYNLYKKAIQIQFKFEYIYSGDQK